MNIEESTFHFFQIDGYKLLDSLEKLDTLISGKVCLDEVNNRIAAQFYNDGIAVWDLKSKKLIKSKRMHKNNDSVRVYYLNMEYNCDGSKIYAAISKTYLISAHPYISRTIENCIIFDAGTLDSIGVINYTYSFQFVDNCSKMLRQNSKDSNGLELYDMQTGKLIRQFNVNGYFTSSYTLSNDNKYLAVCENIGSANQSFWDFASGKLLYKTYGSNIRQIEISNDNKKFIAFAFSGLIYGKTRFETNVIQLAETNPPVLFPNPTNNFVSVNFQSKIPNVKYSVFNTLGEIKTNGYFTADINETNKLGLDFSAYTSGVYFVNLFTGENLPQTVKIVKE